MKYQIGPIKVTAPLHPTDAAHLERLAKLEMRAREDDRRPCRYRAMVEKYGLRGRKISA